MARLGNVETRATSERLLSAQTLCNLYATVQISTATKISAQTKLATTNRWPQTDPKGATAAISRGSSCAIDVNASSACWFSAALSSKKVTDHPLQISLAIKLATVQ